MGWKKTKKEKKRGGLLSHLIVPLLYRNVYTRYIHTTIIPNSNQLVSQTGLHS